MVFRTSADTNTRRVLFSFNENGVIMNGNRFRSNDGNCSVRNSSGKQTNEPRNVKLTSLHTFEHCWKLMNEMKSVEVKLMSNWATEKVQTATISIENLHSKCSSAWNGVTHSLTMFILSRLAVSAGTNVHHQFKLWFIKVRRSRNESKKAPTNCALTTTHHSHPFNVFFWWRSTFNCRRNCDWEQRTRRKKII